MTGPLDTHSWMWGEALALLEHAERRHRRFFSLLGKTAPQLAWEPPVDMFETSDGLSIFVALPGVRAEDVTLEVSDTGLLVRTERPPPLALECRQILRLEIPYGHFERHIDLPPGRYTLRERRMADGCLALHLTKD